MRMCFHPCQWNCRHSLFVLARVDLNTALVALRPPKFRGSNEDRFELEVSARQVRVLNLLRLQRLHLDG